MLFAFIQQQKRTVQLVHFTVKNDDGKQLQAVENHSLLQMFNPTCINLCKNEDQ